MTDSTWLKPETFRALHTPGYGTDWTCCSKNNAAGWFKYQGADSPRGNIFHFGGDLTNIIHSICNMIMSSHHVNVEVEGFTSMVMAVLDKNISVAVRTNMWSAGETATDGTSYPGCGVDGNTFLNSLAWKLVSAVSNGGALVV